MAKTPYTTGTIDGYTGFSNKANPVKFRTPGTPMSYGNEFNPAQDLYSTFFVPGTEDTVPDMPGDYFPEDPNRSPFGRPPQLTGDPTYGRKAVINPELQNASDALGKSYEPKKTFDPYWGQDVANKILGVEGAINQFQQRRSMEEEYKNRMEFNGNTDVAFDNTPATPEEYGNYLTNRGQGQNFQPNKTTVAQNMGSAYMEDGGEPKIEDKVYPPFTSEEIAYNKRMGDMSGRTEVTESPIDMLVAGPTGIGKNLIKGALRMTELGAEKAAVNFFTPLFSTVLAGIGAVNYLSAEEHKHDAILKEEKRLLAEEGKSYLKNQSVKPMFELGGEYEMSDFELHEFTKNGGQVEYV